MKKTNKLIDWFTQCTYWKNHARVLQRMGGDTTEAIEVSITPINGKWNELGAVLIRKHCTIDKHQVFGHYYDSNVEVLLQKHVGERAAEVILHEDLLLRIDWGKFKQVDRIFTRGGGIPFILVCAEPQEFPELIHYWKEFMESEKDPVFFLLYGHLFTPLFELIN